jgi:hypothetical protein
VASWSRFFSTIITNNDSISPDGKNNATKIECPIGQSARVDAIVSGLSAGTYTYSFYAKGNVSNLDVNIYQDATGSTLSSTAIETLINDSEWSRVDITFTSTTSSTIRCIYANLTSGESFHLWGAQIEQGSYATSYIPTYGTTVTRLADNTGGVNVGTLGVTTAYSIFYELGDFNVSAASTWITQSGAAGRMFESFGTTMILRTTSGDVYPYSHGGSGTQFKAVLSFDGTNVTAFANGNKYGPYPADLTKWTGFASLDLNLNSLQTINWKQVLIFPTALTDAQAIELTTL